MRSYNDSIPFVFPQRVSASLLHGIGDSDEPQKRWLSLLAAGVLPGTGRGSAFRLHKESGPAGSRSRPAMAMGYLELFDERLIEAPPRPRRAWRFLRPR